MIIRYSRTREEGACHTACTKLTEQDHEALHWLAVERGISDYEMTRRILLQYIRGSTSNRHIESRS